MRQRTTGMHAEAGKFKSISESLPGAWRLSRFWAPCSPSPIRCRSTRDDVQENRYGQQLENRKNFAMANGLAAASSAITSAHEQRAPSSSLTDSRSLQTGLEAKKESAHTRSADFFYRLLGNLIDE